MPDLNSLVIFAKVVEVKSFSEAARQLQMPVSSVSRRVADLEERLGVRLLERSTRSLRLTDVGNEVLEHAQRSAQAAEAVESIVSDKRTRLSGLLRLSAPPSISDSLLAPLIGAFQSDHPDVRVQVLITDRVLDNVADGMDLLFRVHSAKDSSLVVKKVLSYRHQLLASPAYIRKHPSPESPQDLLSHRLLAFSHWRPDNTWEFARADGREKRSLTFAPYFSMNDYVGLATALLEGYGIGELPPVVLPHLVREGQLVEIMPEWRMRRFDLTVAHLGNRHLSRVVRVFKEFALKTVPTIFPVLPT